MYVYDFTFVCVCVSIYIWKCTYVAVYMGVHMCSCILMYIHMCVYIGIFMCDLVCMYICMYICCNLSINHILGTKITNLYLLPFNFTMAYPFHRWEECILSTFHHCLLLTMWFILPYQVLVKCCKIPTRS